MNAFCKETEGIYRLRVPIENIYTSVFLLTAAERPILVDCATTASDVDECILPALAALGYALSDIGAIVLTHRHADHAGGLARILALCTKIRVISDLGPIGEGLCTYPLAGHTADSIGVFDARTHTLISGDGLQGAGVDKYRTSVAEREAYLETLRRVREDGRIERILFSHAYEPWNEDAAIGRAAVLSCLEACALYVG